jgi:3-phosphoshikimate 1-carboxyvinyltransferase
MLFALPLLDGFSIIEIIGDYESESYVDITIDMLSKYGIRITRMGNRYIIPGSQKFNSSSYTVEGDYSNTAFLHALTLLGGDVTVEGLNDNSVQGDKVYLDIYERLLRGERSFNLSNCPDLAPILFALAAVAGGALFRGTSRLRLKESDRGAAMAEELAKFGITLDVGDDTVRVHNGELTPPTEILNGHNDHRIVMALSVLSTLTGGTINGAQAVAKSYPDFFRVLKNLNVGLTIYEDQ